jgi:hypothetical protein
VALKREPSPGWIECDGEGCPVPPEARVQVQFRMDRDQAAAERLSTPQGNVASTYELCWKHSGAGTDIVAYRQVSL